MKTLLFSLVLASIMAGAKAVIDVAVLDERVSSMRDIILEIKQDTRDIKLSILNMTIKK